MNAIFGTLAGGGSYYKPKSLMRGNEFIEPGEGFYYTHATNDEAVAFVDQAPDGKPLFLYVAHVAPHWPLHALPEDIAKYEGVYDAGWDRIREARHARMKETGILPREAALSPRDLKVPRAEVICFGIYTVSDRTLKLTAQLYPLYPGETREVRLEIEGDGEWREIAREYVNEPGWSATFRVENWDDGTPIRYRLRHGGNAMFEGLVRADPRGKDEIVVAVLSCNSNKDRGLRPEYTRNISHQNPDLVFFAGDQSYDHKQHTSAWLKFGLAFRETFRNHPCVTIPDDHDIGQGNLWGEGGKVSKTPAGHDGGYFFHPEYVKMVERQQCAHLPDPHDPTPIRQGIGVYYTHLVVGGVDFAILEDRKFKTGPEGRHPMKGRVRITSATRNTIPQ